MLALHLAACKPSPPEAGQQAPRALEITSQSVEITPSRLQGLRLRGARVLTANHPSFGGFSGLIVSDGNLLAVTDAGWWLEARLTDAGNGMAPVAAVFRPLVDGDGTVLDKAGGDAEGLAEWNDAVWVSFERDHRIMVMDADGRLSGPVRERAFEALGSNSGMEALATLPGGGLIAIAEEARDGAHPVFTWQDGQLRKTALPAAGRFSVTAADLAPYGHLYIVRRHFSALAGIRIRLERLGLTDENLPDPSSIEVLAEFENGSGIDNMEGISVWTDADGETRLTLVSDDNFNFLQRTLLMDFEVVD